MDEYCNKHQQIFAGLASHIYEYFLGADDLKSTLNTTNNFYLINQSNNTDQEDDECKLLMFCLGGSAYKSYAKMLNKHINVNTTDYDISLSLKQDFNESLIDQHIKTLGHSINSSKILDNLDFSTAKSEKNFTNLDKYDKFCIDKQNNHKKLLYRLCVNYKGKIEHIIELSMWKNGRISDDFYLTDFQAPPHKNIQIIIFIDNDKNMNFILHPLLLVSSTYNAIVDKIRENHVDVEKCMKCVERIKYITAHIKTNTFDLINDLSFKEIERINNIVDNYPFILCDTKFVNNNSAIFNDYFMQVRDIFKKFPSISYLTKFLEKHK